MAAEVPNYIWELVVTSPGDQDEIGEAKDHIFAIKNSLVKTFPKFDKNFTAPATDNYLTFSSDELNDIGDLFILNKTGTPPNEVVESASVDGLIKLSGYTPTHKNMALKFIPEEGTIIELAQPMVELGTVIASPMSLVKMNEIYGSGVFLLCDGQNLPTSKLKTLLPRLLKVPDLRDRIISQADQPEPTFVGLPAPAVTKWVSGVDFNVLNFNNYSHNHNGGNHDHAIPPIVLVTAPFGSPHPTHTFLTLTVSQNWDTSFDNFIKKTDDHFHSITISSTLPDGNNLPNRIILNYYIRVN